jgi:AraC-like DNA-binding protein/mannose-6-phosphate isomerase-like protein (cupin superfamily)
VVQIPFKSRNNQIFTNNQLPVLHYAGQISDDPTWSFPSHKHDDVSEIIYISEGEGNFIIDNRGYSARKGDILIYNRGVLHEERSNPGNPIKTYFCGIGNLHIDSVMEGCIIPANVIPVIHTGSYSHQFEVYISTIFEEIRSQVFGFETICQNTLVSLLIAILRIINSQAIENDQLADDSLSRKIKQFIEINYTKDIPLNEIANRLYISPYYLAHIFKEETGYSPINYLIQRRIGEAKTLLLTTKLTIQEISERVGYDNGNYFSTIFKKFTGDTPSIFRNKSVQ